MLPLLMLQKAQYKSPKAMERIVHGTVVDISEHPYQVGLVQSRGHRKRLICGGAIIKPHIIFTAAHCTHVGVEDERPNLSVLVGANYLNDPEGRETYITNTFWHNFAGLFIFTTVHPETESFIYKKLWSVRF